jgi:hypothetical protein
MSSSLKNNATKKEKQKLERKGGICHMPMSNRKIRIPIEVLN